MIVAVPADELRELSVGDTLDGREVLAINRIDGTATLAGNTADGSEVGCDHDRSTHT